MKIVLESIALSQGIFLTELVCHLIWIAHVLNRYSHSSLLDDLHLHQTNSILCLQYLPVLVSITVHIDYMHVFWSAINICDSEKCS